MIQDSRTLAELEALEAPLRAWSNHPLYEHLLSLFAARLRELAAGPGAELQPQSKPLSAHEAKRVTKRILRSASLAELDSVVERVRLRYAAGAPRDDVENFARLRRERLARVASAVDDPDPSAPPSERRR